MIKAIVFDFFDVIFSDPYNAWLKKYGFVRNGAFLEASQRMDIGLIDMDDFFKIIGDLSHQSTDDMKKEFQSVDRVNFELLNIISSLRKKYKIGLLSNAPSAFIRGLIEKNDLEKYFDEIVVSSEVGYIKPDKEIFEIMISRLNVRPSETVFVDDSMEYVSGANNIGINGFHFVDCSQLINDLKISDGLVGI